MHKRKMVAAVSKRRRRGEEEEEEEEEGEEVEEGEDAGEIEERERPVPARLQSKVLAVSVLGSAEGRGGKRSTAGKRSVDESSRGRNVRMLGALTKHLSAARKSLDGDRHLIEKQTHAQHCALQRNEKSAEQAIVSSLHSGEFCCSHSVFDSHQRLLLSSLLVYLVVIIDTSF
jgi:hypothetical protein